MAAVDQFLAMGGYARFVWPAFAMALIVLGGLLADSLITYNKRKRELAAAEKLRR